MFGGLFNQKKYVVQDGAWGSPQQPQQFSQNTYQQPIQPPQLQQVVQPNANGMGSSMQPEKREEISALSHLDARATTILTQAQQETIRIKQAFIEPDQILFALLFDKEIFKILEQFNLKVADISREIQSKEVLGAFVGQPTLSEQSKKIFEDAYMSAKSRGTDFISPEDILLAMMNSNITSSKILEA